MCIKVGKWNKSILWGTVQKTLQLYVCDAWQVWIIRGGKNQDKQKLTKTFTATNFHYFLFNGWSLWLLRYNGWTCFRKKETRVFYYSSNNEVVHSDSNSTAQNTKSYCYKLIWNRQFPGIEWFLKGHSGNFLLLYNTSQTNVK